MIEAPLDESERACWLRGEVLRAGEGVGHERRGLDDLVHEPPVHRLLGRNLFGEHRERGGALEPDESRQDEGAARIGNDTDLRKTLDEARGRSREHDVAGEREVRAGAGGRAVHGADDRFLECANRTDDRVPGGAHKLTKVRHDAVLGQCLGEVLAGTKATSGAGQKDRADRGIGGGAGQCRLESERHLGVETIEDVRAVQREPKHALRLFGQEGLRHDGNLPPDAMGARRTSPGSGSRRATLWGYYLGV